MHNKTSGFSLIELVIAMVIASILSLMLFGFVRQATKTDARIATAVDYGLALTIAYGQLERDLMAIMVPEASFAAYTRAFKKEQKEKKEKQPLEQGSEPVKAGVEEKRMVEIPPPFLAKFRDNRLDILFFTTTNRVPRHKVFVPYNTRVVYQLVPETEPGIFKLVRFESSDIRRPVEDFSKGDVPSHVLLSRIKSLSMKFFVPEESKQEAKKEGERQAQEPEKTEKKEEPQKKIVYKELTTFNPEELKKATYMIPAYIEISGVRAEGNGGERPFKIAFKIPVFESHHERLKKIVEERTMTKRRVLKAKDAAPDGKKEEKTTLSIGAPKVSVKPPTPRFSSGRAPASSRPQPGRPQVRVV